MARRSTAASNSSTSCAGDLLGDGVPLWRATLHTGTLHPQIRGLGARWLRDRKIIEEYRILHGSEKPTNIF